MHSRFTPVRQYEGFACDVSERSGNGENFEEQKANLKKGLFYLLTFTVDYDSSKTMFFTKDDYCTCKTLPAYVCFVLPKGLHQRPSGVTNSFNEVSSHSIDRVAHTHTDNRSGNRDFRCSV